MDSLHELTRPWKLATLSIGVALLIVGAFYELAPDWDFGISLIMAAVAYLTAPHRAVEMSVYVVRDAMTTGANGQFSS